MQGGSYTWPGLHINNCLVARMLDYIKEGDINIHELSGHMVTQPSAQAFGPYSDRVLKLFPIYSSGVYVTYR